MPYIVHSMDKRWKHPWACILSEPSGCGKTVFVKLFLKQIDRRSNNHFDRIILYCDEWQSAYRELGRVIEFREDLPESSDWLNDPRHKLIIIDNLMRESSSEGAIVNTFTTGSNHNNASVIFIMQNIFHQKKGQRDISLNAQYIVIFRNLRDRAQIRHLARQVCPQFLHE